MNDSNITEMINNMSHKEKDDLALKFEALIGWKRCAAPGIKFMMVKNE